jgi:ParB/RepB/Spo0J family partition protein
VTAPVIVSRLPLTEIGEHPANPRRDLGDLAELAASIREQGVLQPLVVAPDTTRRKVAWVVLAGHRRLRAAKKAGLTDVPVVVREDLATLAQQVSVMVSENVHRADLSPVEESDAYQLLLDDAGLDVKAIAQHTGRPASMVRARLKLQKVPTTALDKLHAGQLTIGDAEQLADLAVKDPDAAERAAAASGELRWAIETEVRAITRREKFTKLVALVDAQSDVPVVRRADLPDAWTYYGRGPGPKAMYGAEHDAHRYEPVREAKAGEVPRAASPDVALCPHRVIVVNEADLTVDDGFCADPAYHLSAGVDDVAAPAGGLDAQLRQPQWQIDAAAARAFEEARAVAQSLRFRWLSEVVAGGGVAAEHTAAAVQLLAALQLTPANEFVGYHHDACSWLRDLPGFPVGDDDDEDDHTPVLTALGRLTPATAAMVTAAALIETASHNMAPFPRAAAAKEWVALLGLYTAAGYPASEWETEEIRRATAAADVEDEDQVPDDDEVDEAVPGE